MSDPLALALLMPIPFAAVEWFIITSYVLYWNMLPPRSIGRWAASAVLISYVVGTLFLQFAIYPQLVGLDTSLDHAFYIEVFGGKLISICLALSLLYQQAKAEGPLLIKPGSSLDGMPVKSLPRMFARGITAVFVAILLGSMLPDEFLKKNTFLVGVASGPLLAILLIAFGVPIFKKRRGPERKDDFL